jgi:hypothetical protein
VVGVITGKRVHVQGHPGVIGKALPKLSDQLGIERTHPLNRKISAKIQPGSPRQIDHDPRKRFVEWTKSVAIADQAALVWQGLGKRLADSNPDIFDGVVGVNVQITIGDDTEVKQPMPCELIEHMIKKTHPGSPLARA